MGQGTLIRRTNLHGDSPGITADVQDVLGLEKSWDQAFNQDQTRILDMR